MASEPVLIRARKAAAEKLRRFRSIFHSSDRQIKDLRDRKPDVAKRISEARKRLNSREKDVQHAEEYITQLEAEGKGPGDPIYDEALHAASVAVLRIPAAKISVRKAEKAMKRLNARVLKLRKRRSAANRARKHWQEALRNRIQRLKAWRRRHSGPPAYTDAWLNGHPATLTSLAKENLRWIKWKYPALYVTSTSRNWGTASYHEQVPTPGFDIAGPWDVMIALQTYIYNNAPGAMLELLGPDNGKMVKNGARYSLPEGVFLENLHDSHDHVMFRGRIW